MFPLFVLSFLTFFCLLQLLLHMQAKRKAPIKPGWKRPPLRAVKRKRRIVPIMLSSQRSSWRRQTMPVMKIFRSPNTYFPVRLCLSSTWTSNGGAAVETKSFAVNSGFSPLRDGKSQCNFYEQYATLYNFYHVVSSRIVVEFLSGSGGAWFGLIPSYSSTAPTNLPLALSNPICVHKVVRDDATKNNESVSLNLNHRNILGRAYDPSSDAALTNADPGTLIWVHLLQQGFAGGNTAAAQFLVTIHQNLVFSTLKIPEDTE